MFATIRRQNTIHVQAVPSIFRRRISAYHLFVPLMVGRYLRRLYRDWSRPVRAWLCMRSLWRRRLAAFERKARYIDRRRYFGDSRCYREARDWSRWQR